jgi:hypothetical protein
VLEFGVKERYGQRSSLSEVGNCTETARTEKQNSVTLKTNGIFYNLQGGSNLCLEVETSGFWELARHPQTEL